MQREQKSGQDMERLLLALQGRLGEEFHVKSDRDGEKTVFESPDEIVLKTNNF